MKEHQSQTIIFCKIIESMSKTNELKKLNKTIFEKIVKLTTKKLLIEN